MQSSCCDERARKKSNVDIGAQHSRDGTAPSMWTVLEPEGVSAGHEYGPKLVIGTEANHDKVRIAGVPLEIRPEYITGGPPLWSSGHGC
jgi:hypothetical protein